MFITLSFTNMAFFFFYCRCSCSFVVMATWFPLTYNGENENRPTAEILTNVLQKCSLSSPLPNISFLSKSLNLIGCHGNRKLKFEKKKKYKKVISSEAIRGIKLKFYRHVYSISLYKNGVLLPLLMRFCCYGNLKFPLTYKGETENWPLLLCYCRYFYKNLQKCSLSSRLANISVFSKPLYLIGCHGNRKAKFEKKKI